MRRLLREFAPELMVATGAIAITAVLYLATG